MESRGPVKSLWLIADKATGEVSYVRHGCEGEESDWQRIGPMAYTSKEGALRDIPSFEEAVGTQLTTLEVEATGFVQGIYSGFPPIFPSVFVLDSAPLPLSAAGASWVDDDLGHPIWTPQFDENGDSCGIDWLDRVLGIVGHKLGMSKETIQAIGSLTAAAEDAATSSQAHSFVEDHIQIALIPEPDSGFSVQGSNRHIVNQQVFFGRQDLSPNATFWLHTTGLVKFSLPELELRDVPAWWVDAASAELKHWAAHSMSHGIVEGIPLLRGGPVPVDISVSTSSDLVWTEHATGCLRLEVSGVTFLDEDEDDFEDLQVH